MNYIYGINAVAEALKARGRAFQWVGMAKERHDIRLQRMIEECRKLGVPVKFLTRTELDQMAGRAAHQGVVAVTSAKQYSDLDDVVGAKRGGIRFVASCSTAWRIRTIWARSCAPQTRPAPTWRRGRSRTPRRSGHRHC